MKAKLKRHVDGVHLNLKPYECSGCLKKFSEKGSRDRHAKLRCKRANWREVYQVF